MSVPACVAQQLVPDPLGYWFDPDVTDGSGIRNDKQPNIRHAFGSPLYGWSFASAAVFPDQEVRWLYEIQPVVEGRNFNKLQAPSSKLQA